MDKILEWALVQLLIKAPAYGALATSFPVILRSLPGTTYGMTNGSIIVINRDAKGIDRSNILALIAHEVNHILMHHTRRPPDGIRDPQAWRSAQEYEAEMWIPNEFGSINDQIHETAMELLRRGIDTTEKIYLYLREHPEKTLSPELVFDRIEFDTPQEGVVVKVLQALNLAKSMGSLPGVMLQLLDELRKPRVDWRSFLRQYWGTKVGTFDLATDRINPLYWNCLNHLAVPPVMDTHGAPDVVLAVDTSGSMTGDPLKEVLSEVRGLAGLTSEVDVYICDADVHAVVTLSRVTDEEVKALCENLTGGGGTSFIPVFEKVKTRQSNPQLLIYFTDTFGEYPEEVPPYPVLWLTPSVGEVLQPPFGQLVRIPPE